MNKESDVLQETLVKLSNERGFSGRGSLRFVVQSVPLCQGPQGSKDDPLAG